MAQDVVKFEEPVFGSDSLLVKLARELAIEHHKPEKLKERFGLGDFEWDFIVKSPRFQELLSQMIIEWQGAGNTHERVKLKAAAMMEEYLPEAWKRMHDPTENLPAKVELAKLVTRLAEMGFQRGDVNGNGIEKFSVTINIGDNKDIKFEHDITPRQVIPTGDM